MAMRKMACCLVLSGLAAPAIGQTAATPQNWPPTGRSAQIIHPAQYRWTHQAAGGRVIQQKRDRLAVQILAAAFAMTTSVIILSALEDTQLLPSAAARRKRRCKH